MWDVKKYIADLKKDTLIKLGKGSGEGIQYHVLKDMVVRIKDYKSKYGKKLKMFGLLILKQQLLILSQLFIGRKINI